jgi:hypothetical protein
MDGRLNVWRSTIIFVALVTAPVPVHAQVNTLIGDVISGSYHAPCDTCVDLEIANFSYFTNPFVVPVGNNTVETALFVGNPYNYGAWDVIVNSDNMTLTMSPAPETDQVYSGYPFIGPVFTILSGDSWGSITGFHVNNPDCVPCAPKRRAAGETLASIAKLFAVDISMISRL